ncbi:hypothetical protein PENNAL_c0002G11660 [Penicillium nalgiovense]|uniref:Uncharacterized protein n=1 Tax=Penicillium nalgiovense TaxID=60175 RepID=A0A1V6Z6T5_PENNA|nr:hypothetical protein PENNAL_c0002G11660 [Penicillium nalgiovense]
MWVGCVCRGLRVGRSIMSSLESVEGMGMQNAA